MLCNCVCVCGCGCLDFVIKSGGREVGLVDGNNAWLHACGLADNIIFYTCIFLHVRQVFGDTTALQSAVLLCTKINGFAHRKAGPGC